MIGVAASTAGKKKTGRKRRKHNSPGVRRVSMASAMALMVFAACIDNAAPAGAASPITPPQQTAEAPAKPATPISIRPVRDAPETAAETFGNLLTRQARNDKLPLETLAKDDEGYTLRGALGAGRGLEGAYLIAVIDLHGRDGMRLHRVVTEARATGNATAGQDGKTNIWGLVREDDLERLAAESMARLSRWIEANRKMPANSAASLVAAAGSGNDTTDPDASLVTGSIRPDLPNTTPDGKGGPGQRLAAASGVRIDVAPAPGDGDRALTAAMKKALGNKLNDLPGGPYKVSGEVVTASRDDGLTDVSIRWVLTGPKGTTLGEVRQSRAVKASAIAGRWGNLADQAAGAAATGILKLVQPGPTKTAAQG